MAGRRRVRGEHTLSVYISTELKARLVEVSRSFDRTLADTVRGLIWIGLPILEGMDEARREAELRVRRHLTLLPQEDTPEPHNLSGD